LEPLSLQGACSEGLAHACLPRYVTIRETPEWIRSYLLRKGDPKPRMAEGGGEEVALKGRVKKNRHEQGLEKRSAGRDMSILSLGEDSTDARLKKGKDSPAA